MKPGDKVRVTWVDGHIAVGTYMRKERGYEVFLDENKKQFVCLLAHVKNIEVLSEAG